MAVCWLENMIPDWQNHLDMLIQNPYCYCIHDKDFDSTGEARKPHVHIMITFPNTTTYKHAVKIFNRFSADYKQCANTAYAVINVRYMYNYLIHDTEAAKKEHKHLYAPEERICGLNFDIGLLEQISVVDKKNMIMQISSDIIERRIINYTDLFVYILNTYDMSYLDILYSYSGHFDRMCKGVFLKMQKHI